MGSWADWFAAIGTVGTLVATLVLFQRTKQQDQERVAFELVAHWTYTGEMVFSPDAQAEMAELTAAGEPINLYEWGDLPDLLLRVQNIGPTPLYVATAILVGLDATTYTQHVDLTADGDEPLRPGVMAEFVIHGVTLDERVTVYLMHQDRTNKQWWRHIGDGHFVAEAQEKVRATGWQRGKQYEVTRLSLSEG